MAAFTLIELLVVVAIIALLITVLLPALSAARAQARSAVCMSNEHQFAVAASSFVVSSKGFLPRGGDWSTLNWIQLVVRQMGNKASYKMPDGQLNVNLIPVEEIDVFQCPERRSQSGKPFLDYVSNALDSRGPRTHKTCTVNWTSGTWREVKGASRVDIWKTPAKVIYVMDAAHEEDNPEGILKRVRATIDSFRTSPAPGGLDSYDVWAGSKVPGWPKDVNVDPQWSPRAALKMHRDKYSNAVFADGHAEPVRPPSLTDPATNTPQKRYQYYLRKFGVKLPAVSPYVTKQEVQGGEIFLTCEGDLGVDL